MELKFARTEFEGEGEPENGHFNYSIKFIKNLKFTEIFTRSKSTFLEWKKLLAKVTIQTDFHSKYNVIKMIGKGSFARVSYIFVLAVSYSGLGVSHRKELGRRKICGEGLL